jgi:hypothetical protein
MEAAHEHPLEPCGFMRRAINGLLDGSLRGIALWYARFHVDRCARCQAALEALRTLRQKLRDHAAVAARDDAELSPHRLAELHARLDRIDADAEGSPPEPG